MFTIRAQFKIQTKVITVATPKTETIRMVWFINLLRTSVRMNFEDSIKYNNDASVRQPT